MDLQTIEALVGALQKRIEEVESEHRGTSRRVHTLDTAVQGLIEEQSYQRRVLDELSSRVRRLTDSSTASQMRLDGLLRDTARIIEMLEKDGL